MYNMSGHLPLLQVNALKAQLIKALFQNYWCSHNWQGPYNENMVVAIIALLLYIWRQYYYLLLFGYESVQRFCSERGTSLRGAHSHFTMRRKFHMFCFVTIVVPCRCVLLCASFPLLDRFICFLNVKIVRKTVNRYKPPVQLVLCTSHVWMAIFT